MSIFTAKLGTKGYFKLGSIPSAAPPSVTNEYTGILAKTGYFILGYAPPPPPPLVVNTFTSSIGTQYSYMPLVVLGFTAPRLPLIFNIGVNQTLNLLQTVRRNVTYHRTIAQTLTFSQAVPYIRAKILNFTQALIFNQSVSKQRILVRHIGQTLNLQQTAHRTAIFNRTATNTLTFNISTTRNTALAGRTVIIPTAIASVVSTNPKKQFVILEIPDRAISLPPPEFNDSESLTDTVVIKRSMNNILYSWVRKNDLRKLKYVFPLGRPKALELRDFVYASIGQIIKMTNWKGEIWMVNITNNPVELVLKSRYYDERELVNITVEFQGLKIAG